MTLTAGRGRRDAWIPWAFVAFFAVVVLVNGIMVALAYRSWTGLTTEDAYLKGLDYNRTLASVRAQEALGWRVAVDFAPLGERRGRLTVSLSDGDGEALLGADVRARFVRPTTEGYDRALDLDELGGGVYGAAVELALAGQWEVELAAAHQGRRYRLLRRIEVP